MVAIADIKDQASFRAWLEETDQPREACIALAARAALRVLPLVWREAIRSGRFSAMPFLRANFLASVSGLVAPVAVANREQASAMRNASRDAYTADAVMDYADDYGAAYAAAARAAADAARAAAGADVGGSDAVVATYATVDVAADTSHAYAYAAANSPAARSAARSAAVAVADADTRAVARAAAWAAIRSDCERLQNEEPLAREPLLTGDRPRWYIDHVARIHALPAEWSFWVDWFRNFEHGAPQPWPLLLEVATQPDAFWQGTDAEINARIAEIVARHQARSPKITDQELQAAADAYPLGERIERDEAGRYVAIHETAIPDDAFALAKTRDRHTVDDMRDEVRGSNRFYGLKKIADRFERESARTEKEPVLYFEAVRRAASRLQTFRENDFIKGDLEAEATIDDYYTRFLDSAIELRVHDPQVQANHEAKERLKDIAPPPVEADKLRAIGLFMQQNSAGILAEQMPEDAETALDDSEPPEVRRYARFRFGGRVVRTLIRDRLLNREAVQDMANAATLIEFGRAHGLVDFLAALVRMLLHP